MAKVVGIDLGTTFSAIAELDDLGNPEVLSDPETGNESLDQQFLAKIQSSLEKRQKMQLLQIQKSCL